MSCGSKGKGVVSEGGLTVAHNKNQPSSSTHTPANVHNWRTNRVPCVDNVDSEGVDDSASARREEVREEEFTNRQSRKRTKRNEK